jgi:hypothetical protein
LQDLNDSTEEVHGFEYSGVCFVAAEEPNSVDEALTEECWRKAMTAEMESIQSNQTWELVTLPAGHRAIGLKWVFKVKKDPEGNIIKHKARLVAKGYAQREGVDFEEVFAPVARIETVRVLIALAAKNGWKVHHMDVKSAFLNGDLEEEVYVQQPSGFVVENGSGKVLKLRKALYGLRQAPRAWNARLDKELLQPGFVKNPHEHAVYRRSGVSGDFLIVGVYVDDLIITGPAQESIDAFKKQMMRSFSMSDLDPLTYYLGIQVEQKEGVTTLCQSAYAAKILDQAGLRGCNPCQVPMENKLKLSKNDTSPVDATKYRSVIGSLRYLVNTRPDLAYSVGIVSRYMEMPKASHWAAVKQILRYVAGTLNYGCKYTRSGTSEPVLLGFSDSDLAGDIDDRKSTSGSAFFVGMNLVTWTSQKQRVVTLSS